MAELTREMYLYCMSSCDSSDWEELYCALSGYTFGEEPEELKFLLEEAKVKAGETMGRNGHKLHAEIVFGMPYPVSYDPLADKFWDDILAIYAAPFLSFAFDAWGAEDLGRLYARISHAELVEKHSKDKKVLNFELFYFEPATLPPPFPLPAKIKPIFYLKYALFYGVLITVLWVLLWLAFFRDT